MDNTKSGWNRLGAFDPKEDHMLDCWIFRSMDIANISFSSDSPYRNLEVLEVGASTLNKAIATFVNLMKGLKLLVTFPLNSVQGKLWKLWKEVLMMVAIRS